MIDLFGGSTSITDDNNPYRRQLAANAESAYGFTMPFLQALAEGQQTPFTQVNNLNSERMKRYYAGRYGIPVGSAGFQGGLDAGRESSTMPDKNAMQSIMQMYGMGSPSAGGTTTTTQQKPGIMDYAQLAAIIAAFA